VERKDQKNQEIIEISGEQKGNIEVEISYNCESRSKQYIL
jgi:hypothetical protein